MDVNYTGSSCDKCGSVIYYDDKYDTYFCQSCNEWLESKCDDPECEYCTKRPEKPIQDV